MHNSGIPSWWREIEFFVPSEFDSPDAPGSGAHNMNEQFVRKIDTLRGLMRRPLVITSGFRTEEHNAAIYAAKGMKPKRSQHLLGRAADVAIAGEDAVRLLANAYTLGFTGFGDHQKGDWSGRFVHLDLREEGFGRWTY